MREKLIGLLDDALLSVNWDSHDYPDTDSAAEILIANDVLPVVRCKDCKHYMTIHCTCDGCCISDDWFCADGERKDNDI